MYQNHPESYMLQEAFGLGTPLHTAADVGHVDIIRELLRNGADTTITDSIGHTPLDRAAYHAHEHVISILQPSKIPVGRGAEAGMP